MCLINICVVGYCWLFHESLLTCFFLLQSIILNYTACNCLDEDWVIPWQADWQSFGCSGRQATAVCIGERMTQDDATRCSTLSQFKVKSIISTLPSYSRINDLFKSFTSPLNPTYKFQELNCDPMRRCFLLWRIIFLKKVLQSVWWCRNEFEGGKNGIDFGFK